MNPDLGSPLSAFDLTGRVAVVTGASSGLGQQFARALRGAGAQVMVAARRAGPLSEIARATGSRCTVCDVTDPEDRSRLVEETLRTFGALDILVNNAGIASTKPALQEDVDSFRAVLETNLVAPFALSCAVAPGMIARGGGSIINIASTLGLVGLGKIPDAAYAASKGGLVNLTRELAAQWAPDAVRVNAIAPGYFMSEMTSSMLNDENALRWITKRDPMRRHGRAGELDGALLYLASAASSYVTGHILTVDGGWTAI